MQSDKPIYLLSRLPQLCGFTMLVMALWAPQACAQTVDYSTLETLFGEPVTTSATGKPQKASDVPVGLEIITADQIRRMGVTTVPEVLARLPGVTNWKANRSLDTLGLRGQNSSLNPSLLVLINGRQVYIDTFGYTDWSLLPVELEEIRQIEVIKGPSTALYGFNAASGVINIITANPKYDALNEVGATAGTGDYRRAYGITTLTLSDAASLRVSAGKESFDEFGLHSKSNYITTSPPFNNGDGKKLSADGLIQVNDQTQLRLETSYARMRGTDEYGAYGGLPNNKVMFSGKASLASETSLGLVEMNLYDNVYHSTTLGSPDENNTLVFQAQDLFKLSPSDTIRLLGEYRENQLEGSLVLGSSHASIAYDVASAGGIWTHAIGPDLEWTNAFRLDTLTLSRAGDFRQPGIYNNDDFDKDSPEYSYNSGIVWRATPKDTFRVATGRGIQAPSLLTFGIDVLLPNSTPTRYLGNPDLAATITTNYEAGYDRSITDIGGKFRSTVFYNQTRGLFTATSPPGLAYQFRDVGDSATTGIEFTLNGTVGTRWIWDGSYTYQNAVDDLVPGAEGYPSLTPIHYHDVVPHHIVKTHLGYTDGPWTSDIFGEAGSSFAAISQVGPTTFGPTNINGYTTLGARVAYTFDNDLTLALMGSDLAQARVANNYGLENERQLYVSLSKKF